MRPHNVFAFQDREGRLHLNPGQTGSYSAFRKERSYDKMTPQEQPQTECPCINCKHAQFHSSINTGKIWCHAGVIPPHPIGLGHNFKCSIKKTDTASKRGIKTRPKPIEKKKTVQEIIRPELEIKPKDLNQPPSISIQYNGPTHYKKRKKYEQQMKRLQAMPESELTAIEKHWLADWLREKEWDDDLEEGDTAGILEVTK